MSVRTVAEIIGQTSDGDWPHDGRRLPAEVIIGWECPACGEWINEAGPRTKCPKDWRNATPSVDVMLAWLRKSGYDVEFGAPRTHLDGVALAGERLVKVTLKPFQQHSVSYRAPTLLAALEAAVRAVDSDATGTSE